MTTKPTKSEAPWMASYTDIWTSVKFRRLVRALAPATAEAVHGHLHRLWHSQVASNFTGELAGWVDEDVADAANWPADARAFVVALIDTGWLATLDGPRHGFILHEWEAYGGQYLRSKEKHRAFKAAQRAKHASTGRPLDMHETSAGQGEDVRETSIQHNDNNNDNITITDITKRESESASQPSPPSPVAAPIPEPEPEPEPYDDRQLERARGAVVADNRNARNLSRLKAEAIYGRPQTVEALLSHMVDGEPLERTWARRFEALDGKSGRPTVAEKVAVLWEAHAGKVWGVNGATVIAWFVSKLGDDNDRHRRAWERDGGARNAGTHPLWSTWRGLKNTHDVPPFEEWLRQREDRPHAPTQQGSGRQPQGPASGATAAARVVAQVLDAEAARAAEVFDDAAAYSAGLAMMRAAAERTAPSTTTKTTKPGVLQ
jgi:hypothetical protein